MSMGAEEKRAWELLPLLADGELSEHEESLVRRMMADNPSLKREGDRYLALKRLTSAMPEVSAPDNLEQIVADRLESKGGVRDLFSSFFATPRRIPLEALGVAAACVLVLFAVVRLVPFSDMKPMDESPVVELAGTADKGEGEMESSSPITTGGDSVTISEGMPEDTTGSPHTRSMPGSTPPSPLDVDLFAEEGTIMEEPEDEVIAGVPPPGPGEALMDADDDTLLLGAAPSGMTATAPAAMTAGETVNRGASATILLVYTSRGSEQPIILTIYTKNPYEAEMTIMNKAKELGGDVERMRTEKPTEEMMKERRDSPELIEGDLPPMVYLPPENVEDLLLFIESNYPPIGPDLEELDMTEREKLLQLEFTAPNGDE